MAFGFVLGNLLAFWALYAFPKNVTASQTSGYGEEMQIGGF